MKTHLTTHITMAQLSNNNPTLTLEHFNTRVAGNDSALMEVLTTSADQDIRYRLSQKNPAYGGYIAALMAGTLDLGGLHEMTRTLNPILPLVKEVTAIPTIMAEIREINHRLTTLLPLITEIHSVPGTIRKLNAEIANIEHRRINLMVVMKILGMEEHLRQCIAERASGVPYIH